jgi:hypothetical protein
MHKFSIREIYCTLYISISLRNLGLTRIGNLDRPYLIILSGHQLTTAAALAVVRARKNAQLETR